MTKIIEGNLILDDATFFDESLEVHGSILGKNGKRYNLTVNGNITAGDITAWNITADDITALDITARNIIASDIYAEDIKARNLNTLDIKAKDLDTLDISARNITAWNIHAGNIYARDITARDITAYNITVRNLDALNINAEDITAKNLDSVNIIARDINADFIICEELVQKPGSTLTATKVINNRSSYKQSAIDNSQFIKQEESIKQEKCNACGQVRRGKEETDISRLKVKQ